MAASLQVKPHFRENVVTLGGATPDDNLTSKRVGWCHNLSDITVHKPIHLQPLTFFGASGATDYMRFIP